VVTFVLTDVKTSDDGCETLSLFNPGGGLVTYRGARGNGADNYLDHDQGTLQTTGTYSAGFAVDPTATASARLLVSVPVSADIVKINGPLSR
jgi:hypothetical protein